MHSHGILHLLYINIGSSTYIFTILYLYPIHASKRYSAVFAHPKQRRKRLQQVEQQHQQRLPQRDRGLHCLPTTSSLGPARSPQGRQRGLPPREEGPIQILAGPQGVQGRFSLHFFKVFICYLLLQYQSSVNSNS